jgi:hypothetical protein
MSNNSNGNGTLKTFFAVIVISIQVLFVGIGGWMLVTVHNQSISSAVVASRLKAFELFIIESKAESRSTDKRLKSLESTGTPYRYERALDQYVESQENFSRNPSGFWLARPRPSNPAGAP